MPYRLAISDCLLIVDSFVQKSIIPHFTKESPIDPLWFKVTFPYIWHPFKGVIVTITIYMIVAVSAERFRAVCYPLSKRHVISFSNINWLFLYYIFIICPILTNFNKIISSFISVTIQVRFGGSYHVCHTKTTQILSIPIDHRWWWNRLLDYFNHGRSGVHPI